jgi:hypothetical protein
MGQWGFAELGITDFSSVAKVCGTKVIAQGQVLSTKIKEEPAMHFACSAMLGISFCCGVKWSLSGDSCP